MHADQSVRQWCRVFATPERSLQISSGAQKMFVQFFVQYPVIVRMHACTFVRVAGADNESGKCWSLRVIITDVSWRTNAIYSVTYQNYIL